jgi:GGDEF domain-containing protein
VSHSRPRLLVLLRDVSRVEALDGIASTWEVFVPPHADQARSWGIDWDLVLTSCEDPFPFSSIEERKRAIRRLGDPPVIGLPGVDAPPEAEGTLRIPASFLSKERLVQLLGAVAKIPTSRLASSETHPDDISVRDSLTGLLNRRGLEERFQSVVGRAGVVLVVRLPPFRPTEASSDFEASEEIVRQIAGVLESSLRTDAWLARWDSREFLIVLPLPPTEANTVVRRIEARLLNFVGSTGELVSPQLLASSPLHFDAFPASLEAIRNGCVHALGESSIVGKVANRPNDSEVELGVWASPLIDAKERAVGWLWATHPGGDPRRSLGGHLSRAMREGHVVPLETRALTLRREAILRGRFTGLCVLPLAPEAVLEIEERELMTLLSPVPGVRWCLRLPISHLPQRLDGLSRRLSVLAAGGVQLALSGVGAGLDDLGALVALNPTLVFFDRRAESRWGERLEDLLLQIDRFLEPTGACLVRGESRSVDDPARRWRIVGNRRPRS